MCFGQTNAIVGYTDRTSHERFQNRASADILIAQETYYYLVIS